MGSQGGQAVSLAACLSSLCGLLPAAAATAIVAGAAAAGAGIAAATTTAALARGSLTHIKAALPPLVNSPTYISSQSCAHSESGIMLPYRARLNRSKGFGNTWGRGGERQQKGL